MLSYSKVSNPVYAQADKNAIRCEVLFDHNTKFVPFVARMDDVEQHGWQIFEEAVNGHYGTIGPFVPPVKTEK